MADTQSQPERRGFARWRRTPYAKGLFTGLGLWLGLWGVYWAIFEAGSDFRVVLIHDRIEESDQMLFYLDGESLYPQFVGDEMTIYWPVRTRRQIVAFAELDALLPPDDPRRKGRIFEVRATTKPCFISIRRTPEGVAPSPCFESLPPD
jgi:hypothetical protein